MARASAFQAEGRGFEARFPLHLNGKGDGIRNAGNLFNIGLIPCPRSSEVEHFLGKEGVTGSIPVVGSIRLS